MNRFVLFSIFRWMAAYFLFLSILNLPIYPYAQRISWLVRAAWNHEPYIYVYDGLRVVVAFSFWFLLSGIGIFLWGKLFLQLAKPKRFFPYFSLLGGTALGTGLESVGKWSLRGDSPLFQWGFSMAMGMRFMVVCAAIAFFFYAEKKYALFSQGATENEMEMVRSDERATTSLLLILGVLGSALAALECLVGLWGIAGIFGSCPGVGCPSHADIVYSLENGLTALGLGVSGVSLWAWVAMRWHSPKRVLPFLFFHQLMLAAYLLANGWQRLFPHSLNSGNSRYDVDYLSFFPGVWLLLGLCVLWYAERHYRLLSRGVPVDSSPLWRSKREPRQVEQWLRNSGESAVFAEQESPIRPGGKLNT